MEFLIILLIICLFVIICLSISLSTEKKLNDDMVKELIRAESKMERLRATNQFFHNQLLNRQTNFSSYRSDPDVTAAVRYAMTKAHPDNGGKTEDFIKFRQVYEKLK